MSLSHRASRWAFASSLGAVALLCTALPQATGQGRDAILAAIDELNDAAKAEDAVEKLVSVGPAAVKHLLGEAAEGKDVSSRGWAIVALSEIGGDEVVAGLTRLHKDPKAPKLVRTWAAAGVVSLAKTSQELGKLADLVQTFPPLGRPIGMRLVEAEGEADARMALMLELTLRHTALQKTLTKAILAQGSGPLVKAMLESKNQVVRRQAAAYLATLGKRGEAVGALVVEVYAFNAGAKQPPWEGGPLFLPSLQPWSEEDAKALTRHLVAWYLWSHTNDRDDLEQQIINNLQSIGLGNITQFWPGGRDDPKTWVRNFGQAFGKTELGALLRAQSLHEHPDYKAILDSLP